MKVVIIFRVFTHLHRNSESKLATLVVYDTYKQDAVSAGVEPSTQSAIGNIIKSTFPDVKNRSVYLKGNVPRQNMYVNWSLCT